MRGHHGKGQANFKVGMKNRGLDTTKKKAHRKISRSRGKRGRY